MDAAPGTWFTNPVFHRELRSSLQHRRTYGIRIGYILVLGLLLLSFRLDPRQILSPAEYIQYGRNIYIAFFSVQMTAATLLAVAAGTEGLVKEVRADTLGLLALTGLSPFQIAVGKWLAALVQAAWLIVAGIPVLAICAFLGAVGPAEILWSTTVSISSAALAGAYAVFFAAGARSSGGIAFLACSAYGLHSLLGLSFPPYSGILHPLTAATDGLQVDFFRLGLTPLASALYVVLLLRAAGARLGSPEALLPLPVKTSKDIEARDSYATVAMENLGLRRVDLPVYQNHPLLWKELKTRGAAQLAPELRLFVLIMLGVLILFALLNGWGPAVFFLMLFVLFVVAITAGASLFSRDREGRRWETLFVTPIRAEDVITAKLLSLPLSSEGLVLAGETVAASVLYLQSFPGAVPVQGVLQSMIFLAFTYVCAAGCSLWIRTPRRALAVAALIPTVILFMVPWLDKIRLATRRDRTVAFSYWIHPFWQFDTPEFTLGFVVYAGIYLAAIALLIRGMIRRFDRAARSG